MKLCDNMNTCFFNLEKLARLGIPVGGRRRPCPVHRRSPRWVGTTVFENGVTPQTQSILSKLPSIWDTAHRERVYPLHGAL